MVARGQQAAKHPHVVLSGQAIDPMQFREEPAVSFDYQVRLSPVQ